MAVAVQRDRMAGGGDLGRQRPGPPHLLADQEERRLHAGGREQLEHRGRALRMRAVVEGDRHGRRVDQPAGTRSARATAGTIGASAGAARRRDGSGAAGGWANSKW